jgi:hypothetical protein
MFAGLLLFPHTLRRRPERVRFYLDALIVLLGGGMVIFYFFLIPELASRALINGTKPQDVVFDPFLGSGTTAVATQESGRVGRLSRSSHHKSRLLPKTD